MPKQIPVFTHEELHHLWTAVQQYIDNQPDDQEEPPAPAASAQEKMDAYFVSFAEPTVS